MYVQQKEMLYDVLERSVHLLGMSMKHLTTLCKVTWKIKSTCTNKNKMWKEALDMQSQSICREEDEVCHGVKVSVFIPKIPLA